MSGAHYILAIDGGGFRGAYSAHLLKRMEDEWGINWLKLFHTFAGTSTGSIIAAGLASGLSASKISEFYKKHGSKIFPRCYFPSFGIFKSRYRNDYLRSVLKDVFQDQTLGQIKAPLILPATDIGNGCVHVFKSGYNGEFVRDKNVLIRDAVMASCSAPTFFDPYPIDGYYLADGGLWANSPSLVAISDAKRRLGKNLDDLRVFSIGTGIGRRFFSQKQRWWHSLMGWGFFTRWSGPKFISMVLNLQSETANNTVGLLLKPDQLLRINFESDKPLPLDEPRDLQDLISRADRDFSHNASKIKDFINILDGDA